MEGVPGYTVEIGESAAQPTAAPSTAYGFCVGFFERGPVDEPVAVISLTDAVEKLGARIEGDPVTYDGLETAFREGASLIYCSREVGKSAVTASKKLVNAGAEDVATVTAKSPGAWGNDIDVVATLSAGSVTYSVKYEGVVVETSPAFGTVAEAVDWAATESEYIDIALIKESDPKTQTIELASGADDLSNADAKTLATALANFSRDLGPGQLVLPTRNDETSHLAGIAHCAANNRRFLAQTDDSDDEGELAEASLALRSAPGTSERFGSMWGPYAEIPGLDGSSTTRKVPYSMVQLGLIARAEGEGRNPNQPAAAKWGRCRYVTGLTTNFTDAQRETLNDAGFNAAILIRGIPTTMGNRTLTHPTQDGDWKAFGASRLMMAIAAKGGEVVEDFEFEQIDGHGYVFADLNGQLGNRACKPFYEANALYGQTPAEAYAVNTGSDVNTPTSIDNEEIKAQVAVRISRVGEKLALTLVKVPTSVSL